MVIAQEIRLRDVSESDLPVFFEHQLDPEAARLAAFAPKDRDAFLRHWGRILRDSAITKKTILCGVEVAGNIVCFEQDGKREVGYWLGKSYWGQGVATRALAEFIRLVTDRPLYAAVAKHNAGSLRVLEKCGFELLGEDRDFATVDGQTVEGWTLRLGSEPGD